MTTLAKSVNIHNLSSVKLAFCLKKYQRNPLSGKVLKRVAPILILSKIKPRFPKKFSRLTIISLLLIFLSGYYPVWSFPPVKPSFVRADSQQQTAEIIASSFPQPVILPHPGHLSARFSRWHPGVDIATGLGMLIHPINEGVVEDVGFNFWGYGNNVLISHANGFKSFYAHMGKVYVKKGQQVNSESMLGEVGITGHTSGPHTHLEIIKDGHHINPLTILPEVPAMPKPEYITKTQSLPLK